MKFGLSEIKPSPNKKVAVPDVMHFVWVGDSNQINLKYIDIWAKVNKSKEVYLWLDKNTSLCDLFHESIKKHILSSELESKYDIETRMKNDAFNYIFPKLQEGFVFDALVLEFLSDKNIPYDESATHTLDLCIENKRVKIKNIEDLFIPEFSEFIKYYYYEIILRGNLASASDIVRLLIIYLYGGVYIDVDTLPYTDNAFAELNHFLESEKIVEDDFLLLMKTKYILRELSLLDFPDNEYYDHYKGPTDPERVINKHQKIQQLLESGSTGFSLDKIIPLGQLSVYKNLLAIGSLRRLKGIYFNNFIASHPGSKAVRIILHTMKKRYRFLEINNCIFDVFKGGKKIDYLSRILTWRTELTNRDYCVTSVLTGPGLIIEVLLGLAYELLDLDDLIDPSTVAEYFQDEKYGIALFQHNLDTPDGLNSSWRK